VALFVNISVMVVVFGLFVVFVLELTDPLGGKVISICGGQKLNTKSSTEAEQVGVDDCMSLILWSRLFLKAQGINVRRNTILQDNKVASCWR